jgi:hypothetical protein
VSSSLIDKVHHCLLDVESQSRAVVLDATEQEYAAGVADRASDLTIRRCRET